MKTRLFLFGLTSILVFCFVLPLETFGQGQGKGKPKGPPSWAPAHGYRAKTRHVYFPEHNVYFDIQKSVYIVMSGGKWTIGAKLPLALKGVNLQSSMQIELDLNSDSPQKFNADHKVKYKVKGKPGGPKPKPNSGKGKGKKK